MKKLISKEKSSNLIIAGESNFDEIIKGSEFVLVDFWQSRCPPCEAMDSIVKSLSEEFSGRVVFAKLNVNSNPTIARRFRVKSVPAFILFQDGKLKTRRTGAMSKKDLARWIEDNITR